MDKFQMYYDFMAEYASFFFDVENVENKKLKALLSNDLSLIETAMSEYQTCIKKAQQYETNRIKLCEKLGFKDMKFKQISNLFEGDEKRRLVIQNNSLESTIRTISYLNKRSMEIAKMQMKYVEELANSRENAHMYNSSGKSDSALENLNLLNKKA